MEMGFSLTRCIEALRHTQSLEQATDYLLQGNDIANPGQVISLVLTLIMLNIFMYYMLPNFYPIINLQHSSCKHVFLIKVETSVDPDQMASSEASLSLSTVFSKKDKWGFDRTMVETS